MGKTILWTKEEDLIIIENYNKNPAYTIKNINRTKLAIYKRAKKLGIKKIKRLRDKYNEKLLKPIILNSKSIREVLDKMNLRKAGGNYKVINNYIKLYNIDVSHFESQSDRGQKLNSLNKRPIEEYLKIDRECNGTSLKKRLYEENILERKCCLCDQDENWNGMKISLILDHINGIHNDNRLENLRIVCPNCNAGLDTFAGKNKKVY